MTMHQELDMLREEVETLRKLKEQQEKEAQLAAEASEERKQQEIEEARTKAEELMESVEEGKIEAKDALNTLLETIKKDYENLSPTSAIVLFALGAAFGHALSSK